MKKFLLLAICLLFSNTLRCHEYSVFAKLYVYLRTALAYPLVRLINMVRPATSSQINDIHTLIHNQKTNITAINAILLKADSETLEPHVETLLALNDSINDYLNKFKEYPAITSKCEKNIKDLKSQYTANKDKVAQLKEEIKKLTQEMAAQAKKQEERNQELLHQQATILEYIPVIEKKQRYLIVENTLLVGALTNPLFQGLLPAFKAAYDKAQCIQGKKITDYTKISILPGKGIAGYTDPHTQYKETDDLTL